MVNARKITLIRLGKLLIAKVTYFNTPFYFPNDIDEFFNPNGFSMLTVNMKRSNDKTRLISLSYNAS